MFVGELKDMKIIINGEIISIDFIVFFCFLGILIIEI